MQMQATDVWAYRDRSALGFDPTSGKDLTGYEVEALGGDSCTATGSPCRARRCGARDLAEGGDWVRRVLARPA